MKQMGIYPRPHVFIVSQSHNMSLKKWENNNKQDAEGIQNMSGVSLISLIFKKWKQLSQYPPG